MTTRELLSHLRDLGVTLRADGDRLRVQAPRGALTAEVRDELAGRKEEILAFLDRGGPSPASGPAITPAPRDGDLPLSYAQQRLFFLDALMPGQSSYNFVAGWSLRGPLCFPALALVPAEIVRRHESLRTVFAMKAGTAAQMILPPRPVALPEVDLERLGAPARCRELRRLAARESRQPFDLRRDLMLRAKLVRTGAGEAVLLLALHHVACDGWSLGVLQREIAVLYGAFRRGRPSPLAPLGVHYADFAVWQRRWLSGRRLDELLAYWRRELAATPALELPADRPRPALPALAGGHVSFRLPEASGRALEELARSRRATLFMAAVAAFAALAHRLSGQDDFAVGTPIANRNRSEIEGLIGFFVNTLALRSRSRDDPAFATFLERTKAAALGAYAHQDLPFERLVEDLRPERDLRRNPLFQVSFALQNAPAEALAMPDLEVRPLELASEASRFDLEGHLWKDRAGRLRGRLVYDRDLFDPTTAARFAVFFRTLLEDAAAAPRRRLSELALLPSATRHQLLAEWSDRVRFSAAEHARLDQLFSRQAGRAPEAAAAVCGDAWLSYRELDLRAGRLAGRLRRLGVGPDTLVGLYAARSLELVTAIVGILEAGGAYLPLDPTHPAERLAFVLDDAGAAAVVTQEHLAASVPAAWREAGRPTLRLDAEPSGEPVAEPVETCADHLAYVIYTSGSTGRPKGTPVTHRAVARLLEASEAAFDFKPGDVWSLFHSPAFDFSVWELWGALAYGGRLVVIPHEVGRSAEAFRDLLDGARVTVLNQTPSAFFQLDRLDARAGGLEALRWVIFGGEALDPARLAGWLGRRGDERPRLANMYGITETTVHVTWKRLRCRDARAPKSPIGRALPDLGMVLLDRRLRPVPPGAAGEIGVAGAGLARGYLGRPALTAERFVPHPWGGRPGERLYRSGDLARRRHDGEAEFLGRIDFQVKVRGFRVELGEIEARLAEHPAVAQAVVGVHGTAAEQVRLVAWFVAREPGAPAVEELRAALSRQVPDHMVPAFFAELDELPRTATGKVDRAGLSRRPLPRTIAAAPAPPADEVEKALAGIWQEVLGLDSVGAESNFFDLGGHSLLMLEVQQKIRERLGRQVPILELFRHPHVRALARFLAGTGEAAPPARARRAPAAGRHVAVIGMAGRFPGAAGVEELWENLRRGVESISFFSDRELLAEGYDEATLRRPECVKAQGVVDGIDLFDAELFGMTRREAEVTDPQQRLLLEAAWSALEDAGYPAELCREPVGVFAGSSPSTYTQRLAHDPELRRTAGDLLLTLGGSPDHLATRISYKLNLVGPSLTVQTACSTSLVAVHLAVRSLLAGECSLALAGGVSLGVPLKSAYLHQPGGITSADGHCRAFDARATGTVSGRGLGLVVLKPLDAALGDGDTIHAVIRGSAINNDGSGKVGYTAPSCDGQAAVISEALAAADVDPGTLGYVEAHGTGTPLGDPIEVEALHRAFASSGASRPRPGTCALGTVKSSIGHLDAAAGVAGLIKAVLAVRDGVVPPSSYFERPNPEIDFSRGPFFVPAGISEWPSPDRPRRAGVSSFGIGGTNAHVVLEEPPRRPERPPARAWQLLAVSGRTPRLLERAAAELAGRLDRGADLDLADAAYTLQVGRQAYRHRRAVVCRDAAAAAAALRAAGPADAETADEICRTAFLFPGQGAQYAGMGRDLYRSEAVFRRELDRSAELFAPHLGVDLRDLLFPEGSALEAAERELAETRFSQPALYAVELALARQWMAWGVRPAAMLGHSLGEYVAAELAGVFSSEDGAALVAERGRIMQELERGTMLAVPLDEETLAPLLREPVALAAVNAPGRCVVSGPAAAIAELARRLEAEGTSTRTLRTSHAFHSAMVEPILGHFTSRVREVELAPPEIPFVSNLTGTWITGGEATDPSYWARHLRSTVRFQDGVGALLELPGTLLLEVGPGRGLTSLALRHPKCRRGCAVSSMRPARGKGDDAEVLLGALGRLWTAGVEVDWQGLHHGEERRRIPLPPSPFERRRYWIEPRQPGVAASEAAPPAGRVPGDSPVPEAADTAAAAGPPRSRRERIFAELAAILDETSGVAVSPTDGATGFLELGLDSLALMQLSQGVQGRLGIEVKFRRLLEEIESPALLLDHLDAALPPEWGEPAPRPAVPQTAAPQPAAPESQATAMGPWRPLRLSRDHTFNPRQQRYLDGFVERYTRRTAGSRRLAQEHREILADVRVPLGFRQAWKELVYPIVARRSAGSRLWDVDGNEYVDLVLGFGVNLLGHAPPFVTREVAAQLERGVHIGPQTELAGEVAGQIRELTGCERVSFCNTGSEAVQIALRLARTATGRRRIAFFSGSYHGISEGVLARALGSGASRRAVPIAPGIPPDMVASSLVLDYLEPESLAELERHAGELAAVLVEPVQSSRPQVEPREFLRELRALTERHGAALVFDEIVTGFRVHPGGAQALFGVEADLVTYGKILGGGMPIGVVAGRRAFLDAVDGGFWRYGDDSYPGVIQTLVAGTFSKHPLALAAARATLGHLRREGPGLQRRLGERTAELTRRLGAVFDALGVPVRLQRFASLFRFDFPPELAFADLLQYHLIERGIHLWGGRGCFLSTAHTGADVDLFLKAVESGLGEMQDGDLLPRPGAAIARPAPAGDPPLPMTEGQKALWLVSHIDPKASLAYNQTNAFELRGGLDPFALDSAFGRVVERHEALRVSFDVAGESQRIAPAAPRGIGRGAEGFAVTRVDLSGVPPASRDAEVKRRLHAEAVTPFDLARGPLFRLSLLCLAPERHVLVLAFHHLIMDGWSFGVLLEDLWTLYGTASAGHTAKLPPAASYRDYVRAQTDPRRLAADEVYWLERFATPAPVFEPPTDRPRPPLESFAGGAEHRTLDAALVAGLHRLGGRRRSTFQMTLLAAFQVLLHRLSGQDDLVVGVGAAGQASLEQKRLVGYCLQMLPLRGRFSGRRPFDEHLAEVRRAVLDASEHQSCPLARLVHRLGLERDPSRPPLVSVAFNLDRAATAAVALGGLAIEALDVAASSSKFDFVLNAVEVGGELRMTLEYRADLFDRTTVTRWLGGFGRLLRATAEDPGRAAGALPLLGEAEKRQLAVEWNDTETAPGGPLVHEEIALHAARAPQRPAVVDGARVLTYGELDKLAGRLAGKLRQAGVGTDDPVALFLERSAESVWGALGVLRAGGAFLPLDPSYPAARLASMLRRAAPKALLAAGPVPAALERGGQAVVRLDGILADGGPRERPARSSPEALAYVIFTSGSTGAPKGVAVPHRGLANLAVWHRRLYGLGPGDRASQVAGPGFDASVWEIWSCLAAGASLHLAPEEIRASAEDLLRWLASERIDVCFLPTPLAEAAARCPRPPGLALRALTTGGDRLHRGPFGELPLYNHYGPTESSVVASAGRVDPGPSDPPIGRPIANTRIYLLDDLASPVPAGVAGELSIAGTGLARGYLGEPARTAERYLPDPLAAGPGGRIYRTGDRARHRAGGEIEFLGRVDQQVQLRGFRIEPGEIEAVLGEHPAVRQAAVVAREFRADERRLVAYVVERHAGPEAPGSLGREQVGDWQALFDDVYTREAPPEDAAFNIVGWQSSLTGEPIPAAEMRQWRDDTVASILALEPRRVLEIGCGTGLLLFAVAPATEHYHGTDVSRRALDYVESQRAGFGGLPQVVLSRRAADELADLEPESYDLVVANSVAQYFPSAEYLLGVVEGALRVLAPGGRLFLGDLRSLPLAEAFHTSVALAQAEDRWTLDELRRRAAELASQEEELLVDPALFSALRRRLPRIGRVEVFPKRGDRHNELTRFRYQVVLEVASGEAPAEALPGAWLDWRAESLSLEALRRRLRGAGPEVLALTAVPNARLTPVLAALESSAESVGELRRHLRDAEPSGVDPQALWALAEELPYDVGLSWAGHDSKGRFDAVLRRRRGAAARRHAAVSPPSPAAAPRPWASYTNDPLRGRFARRRIPELRSWLADRLPAHMVPASWVLLDELPLTANAKVDRAALPVPELAPAAGSAGFVSPRTAAERKLAGIWAEVLGLDAVSVEDDFFHLGGHSLLATRVISKTRQLFGVELPLRSLFEAPTIAALAARVESAAGRPAPPPILPAARPARAEEGLPLSFAQQRLWFVDRLTPGKAFYNSSLAWLLRGHLDLAALARGVDEIVRRHEVLRTRYPAREGRPRQVIEAHRGLAPRTVDLSRLAPAVRRPLARELAGEEVLRPFDLARGPVLRLLLLRLGSGETGMVLTLHHIVCDAWSFGVLERELRTLYQAFSADPGAASPLPELAVQYADFAVWQRGWLSGDVLERQLEHWRGRLEGAPELRLPADRPRPLVRSFAGGKVYFRLGPALTEGLDELGRQRETTPFMTLLAGFQVLLHRLTGQDDVVVGSPIANRHHAEVEGLIGFFVNNLALRADLSGDPSFGGALGRVRETALAAYAHQDLPFERLVEHLHPDRETEVNPLFQVAFMVQEMPRPDLGTAEISIEHLPLAADTARLDLEVHMWRTAGDYQGLFSYARELFDATTLERLNRHFRRLLAGAAAAPGERLSRLPLLAPAAAAQLLHEWNDTRVAAAGSLVHEEFEGWARRRPDSPALVAGTEQWTYGELDRRAEEIARTLTDLGVGPEAVVALALGRSPLWVAGTLGVLKAGGAYLPVNPAQPAARLAHVLEDAAPHVLIRAAGSAVPRGSVRHVLTPGETPAATDRSGAARGAARLRRRAAADELAYVIYTSGSTGRPKGVEIAHRGLANLAAWHREFFGLGPGDRCSQVSSPGFDAAVAEFWAALTSGGALHLVGEEPRSSAPEMLRWLVEQKIGHGWLPTALAEMASRESWPPGLAPRALHTAGDKLHGAALGPLPVPLYNLWGATEATVMTTWSRVAGDPRRRPPGDPPIGRPMPNTRVYLFDRRLRPAPLGTLGELYAAGVGVGRGYRRRPALTAERYLPDPCAAEPGRRLYRTGDLARMRADGEVEFAGRGDTQVKIRGFRIELGEIESVLAEHPGVRAAAVLAAGRAAPDRLVAFVVPDPGGPLAGTSPDALRSFVEEQVPGHMVPALWLSLEALPLTSRGKVDRKALEELATKAGEHRPAGAAPRGPWEEVLAGIWARVLGVGDVAAEDDFFELGGHSLLVTQALAQVRRVFGLEVPPRALFDAPTLAGFARRLDRAARPELPPIEALREPPGDDGVPLSFAQQRLWFLDRMMPGKALYNSPASWRLSGPLDAAALVRSLTEIVRRHAVLRTRYPQRAGRPRQVVEADAALPFSRLDLRRLPRAVRRVEARRRVSEEALRPFDLAHGPVVRALLLSLESDEHVLLLTLHHIACDGGSHAILEREIRRLYAAWAADPFAEAGRLLPALRVQYADFAVWQRRWLAGEVLERQLGYWRGRLEGLSELGLPTDRPRPAAPAFAGASVSLALPAELATALARLGRAHAATLFMTLLAAFQTLLHRMTGQEDVVAGSPVANRNDADTEGLIGFFVNNLVLRGDLAGDPPFGEAIERTRRTALAAYEHQDLPFERLVEELDPERDTSRNPLFQVAFMLQHAERPSPAAAGLALEPYGALDVRTTRLDLELHLWQTAQGVFGSLIYAEALFDRTSIERFARHFRTLVRGLVEDPRRPISEQPVLPAAAAAQLLRELNDTAAAVPDGGVHDLIAAWAERRPAAPAIAAAGERLSYGELDRRADRLAHRLRALGVGPETVVALGLERSPALVWGALGVLKAGGAYLPLDLSHPRERLAFLLADAAPRVLVVAAPPPEALTAGDWSVLVLDETLGAQGAEGPGRGSPHPESLAYVIYTSGSTGRPKGVELTHRGLANLAAWHRAFFGLRPGDRSSQISAPGFDAAVAEIWAPLSAGASLYLAAEETRLSAPALLAWLAARKIDHGWLPTPLAEIASRESWPPGFAPRALHTAGDKLHRAALGRLPVPLFNLYGPTETTVMATFSRVGEGPGDPPIGRPMTNARVFAAGPRLGAAPLGAQGEICVGGAGVARGYRRRPAASAERFVPDPFVATPGERLYRTGDLGRITTDGELEFLGRADHQVKIRGVRIELGEIEAALAEHPAVDAAVVTVGADRRGGPRLLAYVQGAAPAVASLRRHLGERLPPSMVPSVFTVLEALPLTSSGKVDRRALPPPGDSGAGRPAAVTPPDGSTERTIAAVWREVLDLETVGADQSFFELGGHSLLMVQVQQRLEGELGREISILDLFRYPTVRSLGEYLRGEGEGPRAAAAARPAPSSTAIAVIALAGRFPGARDVDELWRNLAAGVESIVHYSREELAARGLPRELLDHPAFVGAHGAVEDLDLFDAGFFDFSPREAQVLDPQQRFFLECSWEALEKAGYDPRRYPGRIGVFAGAGQNEYQDLLAADRGVADGVGPFQVSVGNLPDFLPTRTSFQLDLRGPSVGVHTACSTSLVAVHLACQALLKGECEMALAGGTTLRSQDFGYLYEPGGIVAADGHCRAFDARATGTVGGSGVGVVLLKPLAGALAAGDVIHAVVRGSAVNNDGSDKVGFTAPSVAGQAAAIRDAQAAAGVEPATIRYVEAHGSGTELGDPIEVEALKEAFGPVERRGFCALGSVKTNLGHLDAAAGVAGLIKTVLALEHRQIPPSLHFETPNPRIDFADGPFYVATELAEWPREGAVPRRAGVSSFGIGGTNAHVVLEEAPDEPPRADRPSRPVQLLPVSARTATALDAAAARLADHLEAHPELALADAAFTLQVGRRSFEHRRTVVCRTPGEAVAALRGLDSRRLEEGSVDPREARRPVVFLLPGLGAQHPGMGAGLYAAEPVFRDTVDGCADLLLRRHGLELDLRDVLLGGPGAERALARTEVAQPAVFVLEVALARVWTSWGVEPEALAGHSLGEITAAHLAGVFSLEDALGLAAARGRSIGALPPGAMLAVPLPGDELEPLLGGELSLAAANAPLMSVAAGPEGAVEALSEALGRQGIAGVRLPASHAFHSRMMGGAAEALAEKVAALDRRPPRIPYLSNVTGTWIRPEEATDPEYWARHLTSTVRFSASVDELLARSRGVLLEVGPGRDLGAFARQHADPEPDRPVLSTLAQRGEAVDDAEHLQRTLGRLWLAGVTVDWQGLYREERRRRVVLPTYPFERRRYWVEPATAFPEPRGVAAAPEPEGKKADLADWFYLPAWKPTVTPPPAIAEDREGCWLIFADAGGLGAEMAARLRRDGERPRPAAAVVTVEPGADYRLDGGSSTVDPRRPEHYRRLVDDLLATGRRPHTVVHLWNLSPAAVPSNPEGFSEAQWRGYYSLLFLGQALAARQVEDDLFLMLAANRLHQVGGEAVEPEKATALGPLKVLPQEYPGIACLSIDVEPPAGARGRSDTVTRLLAEARSRSSDADVALRGGRRLVRTFEPVRLAEDGPAARELRPRGVYLITGGLGRVGLRVAEQLARRVRARLVLLGRSAFPERRRWRARLAEECGDRTERKLRRILEIEALGSEVWTVRGDVTDGPAMSGLVARIEERFGRLDGVLHAAGALSEAGAAAPIPDLGPAPSEIQFGAKVRGLYALEQALGERQLDFCFVFSSLSAVLGGVGFAAYCASNLFADAFAAARNRAGSSPWLAVDWDTWPDDEHPASEDDRTGTGRFVMSPAESVEAFSRALTRVGDGQIVVSTGDLDRRLEQWIRRSPAAATPSGTAAPDAAAGPRPKLRNRYVAPRNALERDLAGIWEQTLGIGGIGVHDNFFDLGGHSLIGTQLMAKVRRRFQVELGVQALFENATIDQLAARVSAGQIDSTEDEILARMLEEVAELSPEEARAELRAPETSDG